MLTRTAPGPLLGAHDLRDPVKAIDKTKQLASTFYRRARPLLFPSTIYSSAYPNDAAALELFEGEWTSRLPGLEAASGSAALFSGDERPQWMARAAGGVCGKRVLELGPLEGGHTYQLERLGAQVTAIEANAMAFQRCLIVKNLYQLQAKFMLGDFVRYLETTDERFDAVFASGVLYHMASPAHVIQHMCRVADQVFLWTHYFDPTEIHKNAKLKRSFATGRTKLETIDGTELRSHERRYNSGWLTYFQPGFCGGMAVSTYWLTLGDLQRCFESLSFEIVASETAVNDHGPHVTLMARRRTPS